MRKAITGLAIAALVAGVALVAVSLGQAPSALAQDTEVQAFHQPLDNLLDELVEDGVITEEQRDTIGTAFEERFVRFGKGFRGTPHLETVAEAIGIEVDDLAARLRDGATIAEVAGNRTDEVIAALVAEQETRIEEAVAEGRITAEEAEEVRAALADRVEAMVNGEHHMGMAPFGMDRLRGHRFDGFGMERFPGGSIHGFGFKGGLDTVAGELGINVDELRKRLADGSSLADIAEEEGVDTKDIVNAMLRNLTDQLDALVANERLTQERADEIRDGMTEMIESMINGDMPGFGGFGFGEGFHGHGRGMPGPGGFFGTPDDFKGADTSA